MRELLKGKIAGMSRISRMGTVRQIPVNKAYAMWRERLAASLWNPKHDILGLMGTNGTQ
jgi:hypothetical protein